MTATPAIDTNRKPGLCSECGAYLRPADEHSHGRESAWHVVPLPRCPICSSTARRCMRPSGHEAAEWHAAREAQLAALLRDLGITS